MFRVSRERSTELNGVRVLQATSSKIVFFPAKLSEKVRGRGRDGEYSEYLKSILYIFG